jgi:hypothetical protein
VSELELRASDSEREQVSVALRQACAEGRLTLEELSDRIDRTYAARTSSELAELTQDLPPAVPERSRRRRTRLSVGIFAHVVRRGRLRLGRRALVVSIFGDVDLDLRQAQLDGDHTTLWALAIFGNLDVYVPGAAATDSSGIAVFGHRREWGSDTCAGPAAPSIRVVAVGVFGTVDLWRVPRGIAGGYRDVIRAVKQSHRELEP